METHISEIDKQKQDLAEEDIPNRFYDGLQDSDEIRLLFLHPGANGEKIKCTVKHAKLSEKQPYEALSYMWGPEDVVKSIFFDEVEFVIRQNLWLALQQLRLESESRVLWIDAICINQQNISERTHQVTQMGRIYTQAMRVIVWLGPSDAASTLAFEVLSTIQWWSVFRETNDSAQVGEEGRKLAAVYSLLTREYWTRLWIIQEFLVANDIQLQCGNDKCSGLRFSWFTEMFEGKNVNREPFNGDKMDLLDREDLMNAIYDSVPARLCRLRKASGLYEPKRNFRDYKFRWKSQPLFSLFSDFNAAKFGDQRDKIFGLHSLALDCCKVANPTDYSATWAVALENLLCHQLNSHDCLPKIIPSTPKDSAVGIF